MSNIKNTHISRDSDTEIEPTLPEGWAYSTLGAIGEYLNGRAFKTTEWSTRGRPIIRIQDLTETRNSPNYYEGQVEDRYLVRPGDLLISWSATLGVYIWHGSEGVLNQHIFKVRSRIEKNFHRWLVQSIIDELYKETHGSGMVHITKGSFNDVHVRIPPSREQLRIVAKIEELLNEVNASREHLSKTSFIIKRFRKSVLSAACSGRLTEDWRKKNLTSNNIVEIVEAIRRRRESEAHSAASQKRLRETYERSEENDSKELPEGWRFVLLNKLCASFDYGTSSKSQPSGKVPVLRMGNIQSGEIDWRDLVYTSDRKEIQRYSLAPNTVLFNRTNSPELVGKAAIYRGEREAIFAGYLIRIVNFPELDPQYLNLCLNTNYAREFCLQVKTDGVSQSNINAQKLGSFEVPLCSLDEQHEIVRRVETLFTLADSIEESMEKASKRANKLTQAILAKAFRGELVPTEAELARREGRNYEPAAQLLARIRNEHAQLGAKTRPRRNRTRLQGG